MPGCEAELRDLRVDVSGTIEIREDGTYSFDQQLSYDLRVIYPSACTGEGVDDPELTCALVRQIVEAQGGSAACTAEMTGCACDIALTQPSTRSGTYEISDERLTVDEGSTFEFCVQGYELMLHDRQNDATVAYWRAR